MPASFTLAVRPLKMLMAPPWLKPPRTILSGGMPASISFWMSSWK
jgi:hypothetical protein